MVEENADFEDLQLLDAAANWAESGGEQQQQQQQKQKQQQQKRSKASHEEVQPDFKPKSKATHSLHVTQLSYEATDFDVRDLFVTKGCLVTSVRLVKDSSGDFKGVAFVDVQDKKSFELALKCHRITHLGRRINVRPVLSKEDLSRIAEATKEKVSEIILASSGENSQTKRDNNKSNSKVPPKKNETAKNQAKHKRKDRRNRDENGEIRKLTKKERNRKAAILLAKKRARNPKK